MSITKAAWPELWQTARQQASPLIDPPPPRKPRIYSPDPGTLPGKVYLTALQFREPIRLEELVVACWLAYPQDFGLPGYTEHYPDSNKVKCVVVGDRGLVRRGCLRKVAPNTYEVAPKKPSE